MKNSPIIDTLDILIKNVFIHQHEKARVHLFEERVEFNIDAHMPSFLNTIQIKYRAWSEKVVGLTKDPNEEQIYGEGWERLGYQRPLGKFLYSFGLLLPQIVLALAVAPLLKYTASIDFQKLVLSMQRQVGFSAVYIQFWI